MRIGLIGTGSTGKTTVAQLLEARIPEKYRTGVMRPLLKERGLTEQNAAELPLELQWNLQKAGFDRKLEQDLDHDTGIFDRTLLDHFVYCLFRCSRFIEDSVCKSMLMLVEENLAKYDILFYFQLFDWPIDPDGVREDRLATRAAVDLLIQGLLKELRVNVVTIPDIGPLSRTEFMINHIELKRIEKEGEASATAEGVVLERIERSVAV